MKTEAIEKIADNLKLKKAVAYAILLALVFLSAVFVVFQVFEYRQDYRKLSTYMRERDDLNAEWGRLLIEQQTFGATAQIGTRAVTQLRMYSPPVAQTVVISLPQTSDEKK
ncbi:cell division protein FtsL [Acinetobacter bouvetii DSM 14964 = CIP 107468]|jgi:cell division protein FtsL|uniref:Cell division protein FtsL n=3 Tax=Acinetobacter TaxID=469 RepID=N9DM79_9GAMM|nr:MULTISPECIES: cell division protein FtsL [Acinetobacter]QXW26243.1 cell division protein FtsL [Acinetobacter johnsonii]ENV81533.1 cell division protein FtsL [Acinetobacter bouvetii DSM 14964 = CIP 107468]MCW8038310.1 cell division protein FtsL [Acinetobacter entericus]RZG69330.1 cell division protein FtsL [Acinetobacter bouvetii]TCB75351.1 cell division protein FtsL [Acinetobacter sp. ANC 4177]